jgi:hypothetical protein
MGQNHDHLPLRRFRSSLRATTLASGLLAGCADQLVYRVPTYSYAPQERESVVQAMDECHMTMTTVDDFQTCMTKRGFGLSTPQPTQQTPPAPSEPTYVATTSLPSESSSSDVPLQAEGGTLVVPVLINNAITLKFVVDTGAADVSIPADVVLTLIRAGTISRSDFLGTRT